MGCLVTGNLLQLNFLTAIAIERGEERSKLVKTTVTWSCKLNILGYFPVVSLITGIGRALLGIIHTIGHLVQAIFAKNYGQNEGYYTDRQQHLEQALLGAKNIGRGLIEAIPVVGNLSILIFDRVRISQHEKLVNKIVDQDRYSADKPYLDQSRADMADMAYLGPYSANMAYLFVPQLTGPIAKLSIAEFKQDESKSFIF